MCDCCCGDENDSSTILSEEQKKKNKKIIIKKSFDNLSILKSQKENTFSMNQTGGFSNFEYKQYKPKIEDFYFARPMENEYTNNELLSMNVVEIILGVHPTRYRKDSNLNKSFHPFFYLKLDNQDIENFGVVVQYLKVPENVNEEPKHLYEENGVEFIEKKYEDFENELKIIFSYAENMNIPNIDNYLIKFNCLDFDRMTLGDFFRTAIPEKGVWVQNKINPLDRSCFAFCKNTLEAINIRKKKKNSIKEIKNNLKSVIDKAEGAKYYDKYVEGFEILFDSISA